MIVERFICSGTKRNHKDAIKCVTIRPILYSTDKTYISSLERPYITARGIRRAMYLTSIEVCSICDYNSKNLLQLFVALFKSADKGLTPAQRLGITDKQFDWKDIIYFK